MTVALLAQWGGQPAGTLYTSDAATEAALIAAKEATSNLAGSVVWVPPGNSPSAQQVLLSPAQYAQFQGVLSGAVNYAAETSADIYRNAITKGALLCDWRGTLSGVSFALDATANCPAGTAVVTIAGDAATDGLGAAGASNVNMAVTAIPTTNLKTVGVWAMCPARNAARKNYRNVPLKMFLSQDATFTNYIICTWNVRADGKWRLYALDLSAGTNNAFVFGTNTIGYIRVRASVDQGVLSNALSGTAPLQTAETAYIGGVFTGPKAKAMAMVRFDDGLSNLNSISPGFNFVAPYVGQSGVTVPTGLYSALKLVSMFGLKAACFILTKYVGTSAVFASQADYMALQNAGWEICWQTHNNPVSASNAGVRLLGPFGLPWFAAASNSYATDGTITTIAVNDFAVTGSGQGTPIQLVGSPPSPLATGVTYWVRQLTTTTHKLHYTEADSLAATNTITFASASSATWGWNFAGASADASAINAEFASGLAAMSALGLNGAKYWAPNQGAFDAVSEDAYYANGFIAMFPTNELVTAPPIGKSSQYPAANGLGVNISHLPTFAVTQSAFQTDTFGATEAQARAYVQNLCTNGAIGQNFHHSPTNANSLVLAAYLDELKLRQDRGEIEVAVPSRIARYAANVAA